MVGMMRLHLIAALLLVSAAWLAQGAPADISEHPAATTAKEPLSQQNDQDQRRGAGEVLIVNAAAATTAAPAAGGGGGGASDSSLIKPSVLLVGLFLAATKVTVSFASC